MFAPLVAGGFNVGKNLQKRKKSTLVTNYSSLQRECVVYGEISLVFFRFFHKFNKIVQTVMKLQMLKMFTLKLYDQKNKTSKHYTQPIAFGL